MCKSLEKKVKIADYHVGKLKLIGLYLRLISSALHLVFSWRVTNADEFVLQYDVQLRRRCILNSDQMFVNVQGGFMIIQQCLVATLEHPAVLKVFSTHLEHLLVLKLGSDLPLTNQITVFVNRSLRNHCMRPLTDLEYVIHNNCSAPQPKVNRVAYELVFG